MNIQETENNVDMLLSTCGFKKQEGEEQPLRALLHHLYTAVAMYKETSFTEKAIIAKTNKKFSSIFDVNFNLKQRKRNNKEKDRVPPRTPLQDKENKKEKDEKPPLSKENKESGFEGLDDDQIAFWKECEKYIGKKYSKELVESFFYYFAEKGEKGGKMFWQTKKRFNIALRLAAWSRKSYAKIDEAAAIRLEKAKGKQAKEAEAVAQQQVVAAVRQQENQEREAEIERRKAGAISAEEYAAKNPNSFIARLARERAEKEKRQKK